MRNQVEIVLHTLEGFIVKVESTELKNKFFASSQYQMVGDCPLEKFITFIREIMKCQVPEESRELLQCILLELGQPQHQQTA
jgi:hypothetical protein